MRASQDGDQGMGVGVFNQSTGLRPIGVRKAVPWRSSVHFSGFPQSFSGRTLTDHPPSSVYSPTGTGKLVSIPAHATLKWLEQTLVKHTYDWADGGPQTGALRERKLAHEKVKLSQTQRSPDISFFKIYLFV